MGKINRANFKKAIYYLKRNGLVKTWYAVRERLAERGQPSYIWCPPPESRLAEQRARWERVAEQRAEWERIGRQQTGGQRTDWERNERQQTGGQRTDWERIGQQQTEGQQSRRQQTGQTQAIAPLSFSILVPVYRTKPEYLRELLESLRAQTYPRWEAILADATEDDSVEQVIRSCCRPDQVEVVSSGEKGLTAENPAHGLSPAMPGGRIRYLHLARNAGIAENTNQALPYATGDYIGLLDHDDILTPDALYEMAEAMGKEREKGLEPAFLYSDEDKCNGDRTEYFEPNFKEDFNFDLLLSNNYICHFLVMKRELMQELRFRPEYDGAQDFDLVLRAVARLKGRENAIIHIPRVLYHWRCHPGSTAENPESKRHAYEAGRRAVQDFADRQGWRARVLDTEHVGFYRLRYEGSLFESRQDIGAVGGRLVRRGKICGGCMKEDGTVVYQNLPVHYSGYLHRAVLGQDAEAVDLRNMKVRPECGEIFRRITGVSYRTVSGTDIFDVSQLPEGSDIRGLSLKFCQALRKEGYRILYLPEMTEKG